MNRDYSDTKTRHDEIRAELRLIDEDEDVDLTSFEAGFVEVVVYQSPDHPLSPRQEEIAEEIIEQYRPT